MPTITLLRHGQASFGAADYDQLSPLGRQQADLVAQTLAGRGLRRPVVTSGTLLRQVDTAQPLVDAVGATTIPPDDRWNEYDHVGLVMAHATTDDPGVARDPAAFQRVLDRALAAWIHEDAEDGWRGFNGGAVAALSGLARALEPGQDAVVATSGGVIAAVCGHLLGLGADGIVALNRVTVNVGLTTILIGGAGPSLLTFNDHAHFAGSKTSMRTYR